MSRRAAAHCVTSLEGQPLPISPSFVVYFATADIAAGDLSVGRGGEAVRCKSDDEDRKSEDQNAASENEHTDVLDLFVLDKADQMTGESRDADIEQEPHRHVVGAKVNPDHRADLEVDEQKQQILDRRGALLDMA
jgi:hypothetical protein